MIYSLKARKSTISPTFLIKYKFQEYPWESGMTLGLDGGSTENKTKVPFICFPKKLHLNLTIWATSTAGSNLNHRITVQRLRKDLNLTEGSSNSLIRPQILYILITFFCQRIWRDEVQLLHCKKVNLISLSHTL